MWMIHLSGLVERDLFPDAGSSSRTWRVQDWYQSLLSKGRPEVAYGLIRESNGVPAGIWPSKGGNREAGARERLEVLGTKGTAAPRCRRAFPGNTGHLRYGFEDSVPLRRPIGAG